MSKRDGDGNVCDVWMSTQKVLTLLMGGDDSKDLIGFKRVEMPHCFVRILDSRGSLFLITTPPKLLVPSRSAPESSKLGFSLRGSSSLTSRARDHLLSLTSSSFILLAVLPAPGFMKVPLFFLGLQV